MRVDRIASDDIVEGLVKERSMLGRVTEVADGVVYFRPISPPAPDGGTRRPARSSRARAYGFHSADTLIAMISLCCAGIQIALPHR